jgi:hypothetical protein
VATVTPLHNAFLQCEFLAADSLFSFIILSGVKSVLERLYFDSLHAHQDEKEEKQDDKIHIRCMLQATLAIFIPQYIRKKVSLLLLQRPLLPTVHSLCPMDRPMHQFIATRYENLNVMGTGTS